MSQSDQAVTITRASAHKAFEAWESQFREYPDDFFTHEEAAAMEVATLSEQRAIFFMAFLRDTQQVSA